MIIILFFLFRRSTEIWRAQVQNEQFQIVKQLLEACWNEKLDKRPTMETVLSCFVVDEANNLKLSNQLSELNFSSTCYTNNRRHFNFDQNLAAHKKKHLDHRTYNINTYILDHQQSRWTCSQSVRLSVPPLVATQTNLSVLQLSFWSYYSALQTDFPHIMKTYF